MCRKLVVVLIVAMSGCGLTQYRQQGVELSLVKIRTVRDDAVVVAKAVKVVSEELTKAVQQDRPPDVVRPMEEIVKSLERIHGQCEIAGKILSTMQADLGRSEKPIPQSDEEIKQWVGMYTRTSAMWGQITSILASRLPPMLGGIVAPKKIPGVPWSPVEIIGLITGSLAAVGALGEGTRRGVKRVRAKRANHAAVVEEALSALDELKKKHPGDVKKATTKEKCPHLRAAFVRREDII